MTIDFNQQFGRKLTINEKERFLMLNYSDILFFESNGNLLFVFSLLYDSPVCYSNSLSKLESELEPFGFLRIHNKWIANMRHVVKIDRHNHQIHLANGKKLEVSRRKWQKLKQFCQK